MLMLVKVMLGIIEAVFIIADVVYVGTCIFSGAILKPLEKKAVLMGMSG